MKEMKTIEDDPFFGLICAECAVPGREIELPDGTTCYYCQICGWSKATTIDFFEEMKSQRRVKDDS